MVRRRDCLRLLATGLAAGVTGAGETAARASGSRPGKASDGTTAPGSQRPAVRVAKLVADDGEEDDFFGREAALDDDTALIGAPFDDTADGERAGSAYVFERSTEGWQQTTKLGTPDGEADGRFGGAVALDGDTALVETDAGGGDTHGPGAAHVFERTGDDWRRTSTLTAGKTDDEVDGRFGKAVALDDDTALVGASGPDPNWDTAGAAYVFERSADGWDRSAALASGDGDLNDQFGEAVALDGDTALVGAPGDEDPNGHDAGSAYAFERSADGWRQAAKLLPGDGVENDRFGSTVALDGDAALVASPADDNTNGDDAGSAYVFERAADGWRRQAALVARGRLVGVGNAYDQFGAALALEGPTALIGAPFDDTADGEEAGAVYLFGRTEDEDEAEDGWDHLGTLVARDGDSRDRFGEAVALDGDAVLVGASRDQEPNGYDAGSAYVFDRGRSGPVAPDVTGDGDPATDPDGDGLYEDVDGDGHHGVDDATVLFDAVFDRSRAVTDDSGLFDFNGDGGLTPADATALFEERF